MIGGKNWKRMWYAAISPAMLIMAGCDGANFGGFFQRVTVELVNATDYPVDPQLYADDDPRTFFAFNIRAEENFVDVGVIPPQSSVVVSLICDDAGTMQMYEAVQVRPSVDLFSDNDPIVYDDDDFDCGDTVSFVFREFFGDFRTEVEVNGRVIIH